jgi:hypothetical protein
MFVMEQLPKVIGMVTIPDAPKKHKCICDDCKDVLDDSFGDPRNRVTTEWNDGRFEERWICDVCADEQFGDHEPYSIFDGTPDWMRMI